MNKETLLNKKAFRNKIYELRRKDLKQIKRILEKYDFLHKNIVEESRLWNDITKMMDKTEAKTDELIWERGTEIVKGGEKKRLMAEKNQSTKKHKNENKNSSD